MSNENNINPAVSTPAVNPLLQKIKLPGETFRIPSGGLLYEEGVLADDITNGEVHVYPMTAIDEILLKSPDKLFSGDAIKEIFSRCVPGVLKVHDLFAKDVDFLLIALRNVSYGASYDIKYKHDCENAKNNTYTVDVKQIVSKSKRIDPTTLDVVYKETLSNGQVVKFVPMKFKHILAIMQSSNVEDESSPEQEQRALFDTLISVIREVDGISDMKMILEWLTSLPIKEVRKIMSRVEMISDWGPSHTHETKCKDCEKEVSITIPINPLSFFT